MLNGYLTVDRILSFCQLLMLINLYFIYVFHWKLFFNKLYCSSKIGKKICYKIIGRLKIFT